MKGYIYKMALGTLMLAAAACDLDLSQPGSVTYVPGDPVITTNADLIGFEAGVMASMRDIVYDSYDEFSDIQADYFNASGDFGNNVGDFHRSDDSFNASSYNVQTYWSGVYSAIKDFNVFIEGSESVPDDINRDVLKRARGEAFFGRAYAYQILARHFGPAYSSTASSDLCVPLVLVYDQNARPARSTVSEVYAQIKADLDSAAVLLSAISNAARAEKPTPDAVKAMQARWCLDTGDWSGALAYAEEVINSGLYSLSDNDDDMISEWVYDSGSEPILQYYASMSEGAGEHGYYYGVTAMGSDNHYTNESYIPTKELVESYSSGDLRLKNWFGTTHPAESYSIRSRHIGQYYNDDPDNPDYLVFSKYKGNPNYYPAYPNSTQARKPLLINEMYLIAAEACSMSGDTAGAKAMLNAIQDARNAQETDGSLESVKKEWYRETVGQGLRLSCLKRWGEGFSGRTPQDGAADLIMTGEYYDQKVMEADAYQMTWPIPTYDMEINSNLVQNPGYADISD